MAVKKINLALQGGGAHGAFTWGVLDSLLADPRVEIEGISGASAGAINAVVLADGLRRGGAKGAQARLAEVWRGKTRSRPVKTLVAETNNWMRSNPRSAAKSTKRSIRSLSGLMLSGLKS